MSVMRKLVVLALAASVLAGCSSFKKLTGQRNDTVLPGERENILPPESQVNRSADVDNAGTGGAGGTAGTGADLPACEPNSLDPNCQPPIDQEASGDGLQ
jgi:uncharacterized protein YceK